MENGFFRFFLLFFFNLAGFVSLRAEPPKEWSDLKDPRPTPFGYNSYGKVTNILIFYNAEHWGGRNSKTILKLFNYTNYPKYTEWQFGPFSFLPSYLRLDLFYKFQSKNDERGKLQILTYYQRVDKQKNINTLFPLYFYTDVLEEKLGEQDKVEFYRNSFSISWLHLHRRKSLFSKTPEEPNSTVSENKAAQTYQSEEAGLTEYFYSYPILPLISHWSDPKGTGFNILGIFHVENDSNGLETFWLTPIFYYKKKSYNAILPLYFTIFHKTGRHVNLIGLFDWQTDTTGLKSRFWFLPLLYHKPDSYSVFLPFYFTAKNETGRHINLIGLFDWQTDTTGLESRFWFLPLFYYKPDSYFVWFPLYMQSTQTDQESSFSYGLLHYYQWNGQDSFLFSPLYVGYWEGNKSFHLVAPLLYMSWSSPDSSWDISPLYLNYEEGDKKLHINLSGVSLSWNYGFASRGSGENYETARYFDFTVSWFYNLVSVTNRLSKIEHQPQNKKEEEGEEETKKIRPAIITDISDKKGNAFSYFDTTLLFGLISYNRIDLENHFRILPLFWFEWGSETQLDFFFPLYFSYTSKEIEYKMYTPLFALQRTDDSYISVTGFILFWYEHYPDKKRTEYSVLWPIINFYESLQKDGFRFLPLFWYKKDKKENEIYSSFLSPLYMGHYEHGFKDKSDTSTHFFPSLLFYLNTEGEKYIWNFALLAGGSRWTSSRIDYVFPLFYYGIKKMDANQQQLFLSLLYMGWFEDSFEKKSYSNWHFITPLLLYLSIGGKTYSWDFALIAGGSKQTSYSWSYFFPLYYFSNDQNKASQSLYTPMFSYDVDPENLYFDLFYVLFRYKQRNSEIFSHGLFLDLIWYEQTSQFSKFSLVWSILYSQRLSKKYYSFSFLAGLFSLEKAYESYSNDSLYGLLHLYEVNEKSDETLLWIAPILTYYNKEQIYSEGVSAHDITTSVLYPIWYQSYSAVEETTSAYSLFGLLYYRNQKKERGHSSQGSLWGILWKYEQETENGWKYFSLLGGLYKYTVYPDGKTESKILGITF